MKIKVSNKIIFFPIQFVKEKNEDFFITCNNQTHLIDYDSKRIIELLKKYKSAEKILQHTSYYTEKEILQRINNFLEINIVKQISKTKFENKKTLNKYDLKFFSKGIAEGFFSLPSKILFSIIVIGMFFIIASDTKYFPRYEDYFFDKNYLVCLLVLFVYAWLSTFKHEFAHFIAARSKNVSTTFSLSSRANFLVAQTEFENIYTIKEKNRFRLYLAGIFSDVLFIGVFIIVLFLSDQSIINLPKEMYLLLKSFILIEFLGVIWQFLLFMKTDVYLFLSDVLDKETLMEDSKAYFKNIFKIKKQKSNPLLFMFGIFVVMGIILIVGRYISFDIPIKLKVIEDCYKYLVTTATGAKDVNVFEVASYTFAIFIQIFEIFGIIFFAIKKRINKDLAE